MGIGIKRSETGGQSSSAPTLLRQVGTFFSRFNKQHQNPDLDVGPQGEAEKELSLSMDDEQLDRLQSKWLSDYDSYYGKIKGRQDENEKYWLGKQYGWDLQAASLIDNIIFESVETLLPLISRQVPTPLVMADNTPEGIEIANTTATVLSYIADREKLKLKIKQSVRHWSLFLMGCLKAGWDFVEDDIRISVVNPKCLIMDPMGFYDGGEFNGRYVGERKKAPASELVRRFPSKSKEIKEMVRDNMGTEIGYIEWWTDEYVFWSVGSLILDKRKNPHWNYPEEMPVKIVMDEFGNEAEESVALRNHFKTPKKPYSFLWVFNTGKQPHDETSLIEQTKSLQDAVNKRSRQIDKNADDTNNGWIFNNTFDQDSANRALNALRRGGAIIAPTPQVNQSVDRMQAPPLANYVIEDMFDKREQIRNIMGVRGSTAQGIMSERTVRGKIEIKGQDIDRLSLIVEHVEQTVDHLFNLITQLMYVYYDEPHMAALVGSEQAQKYAQIEREDMNRELIVSIKEGSMIPQDPLMRRNEAVELFQAGAIDPLTLFERLDFPNPQEMSERLAQYQNPGVAAEGPPLTPEGPQVEPQPGQLPALPPL